MNTPECTKTNIGISGFDFNTQQVETIHRMFSGERSQLIQNIDDRLRCWAMSSSSNPNLAFDYVLNAQVEDGKAIRRIQTYSAAHVYLEFSVITRVDDLDPAFKFIHLPDPKQAARLYDLAFAQARAEAPIETIGSYFSLREVIARVAAVATKVYLMDNHLNIGFVDENNQAHFLTVSLIHFDPLHQFIDQLSSKEAAIV
jgi:hypothetical protein